MGGCTLQYANAGWSFFSHDTDPSCHHAKLIGLHNYYRASIEAVDREFGYRVPGAHGPQGPHGPQGALGAFPEAKFQKCT